MFTGRRNERSVNKAMMPSELFLLRHIRSEPNEANSNLRKGEGYKNPASIVGVPQFECRAMEDFLYQARAAGDWFRCKGIMPDAGLISSYVRTCETALETGLPLDWMLENRIREQCWGDLEVVLSQEQYDLAHEHIRACLDGHWLNRPGGGESMLDVMDRACLINDMLARNYPDKTVLEVSHGQLMVAQTATYFHWAFTDLSLACEEWPALMNPVNCQIVQFTRRAEPESGEYTSSYKWVRSIVPWDPNHEYNMDWRPIVRKKYDLDALRELVERYPRHFPSTD